MVDTKGIATAVMGLTIVVLISAFAVIMTTELEALPVVSTLDDQNQSTEAATVLGNGTDVVGSVVTDWGDIIVLGIVFLFVFVGLIFAFMAAIRRTGGER